jgi:hypothetical protein
LNALSSQLFELYKNGQLQPSTDVFLKKHLGVNIDQIVRNNPERETAAIAKTIKEFLAKDTSDMNLFVRRQKIKLRRETLL